MAGDDDKVHKIRGRTAREEENDEIRESITAGLTDALGAAVAEMGYYEVGPFENLPAVPMRWKWQPGMTVTIGVTISYADE